MLKLTNEELMGLNNFCERISERSNTERFPFNITYWVGRLSKKISTQVKEFGESKQELLDKFGTRVMIMQNKKLVPDPKGTYQFEDDDKRKEFNKFIKDLAEMSIEVDFSYKFKASELSSLGLSVTDWMALEPIVNMDVDTEEVESSTEEHPKPKVVKANAK